MNGSLKMTKTRWAMILMLSMGAAAAHAQAPLPQETQALPAVIAAPVTTEAAVAATPANIPVNTERAANERGANTDAIAAAVSNVMPGSVQKGTVEGGVEKKYAASVATSAQPTQPIQQTQPVRLERPMQVAVNVERPLIAQPTGAPPVAVLPAIILNVLEGKDRVVAQFPAGGGLTGWAIIPESNPTSVEVIYSTADNRFLVVGNLLSATEGKKELTNLTEKYVNQYKPTIDMEAIWPQLEKSTFIREGAPDNQAKTIIYGFFDPNCIYCHLGWKVLEPYTHAGLQIRWIPVGMLAASSKGKAAAILQSSDSTAAMIAGHKGWKEKNSEAFPIATDVRPETATKLDANLKLMKALGANGTPAFVLKDKQGQIRKLSGYIPPNRVQEITGMPTIPSQDPEILKLNK